jgi:hypothetical protein
MREKMREGEGEREGEREKRLTLNCGRRGRS